MESNVEVNPETLFFMMKFSRTRRTIMFITGFNMLLTFINITFGDYSSIFPFMISMFGYYGANVLNECYLFIYLMTNFISLIGQGVALPEIINHYSDYLPMYSIIMFFNLILLLYVGNFYRNIRKFKARIVSLQIDLNDLYYGQYSA